MGDGPDAFIFDLDGVVTFTARVHAAAWKELFDSFLRDRSHKSGEPFRPFHDSDYYAYVDGKPRYDGVLSFLHSRDIHLAYGSPSDSASAMTVCGLGNRKNELFNQKVREEGVDVDQEAMRLVRELRARGVRTGIASSSKNAVPILEGAGIRNQFDAVVDGLVSERLQLRGKPQPDIFLQCLSWLIQPLHPQRAAIAEDAIAGVEAGRLGGFGLVLGVDRENSGALKRHGADWVIGDFREIDAEKVLAFFTERARAA
jgi:HAD superfamily hydrolase (TIGR01509 family)